MAYTLSHAAKLAGVPQPTVTRWVKAGVIRPEDHVGRQGVRVRFGEKELRELKTLSSLRGAGMSFQALRRAAEQLRAWGDSLFSGGPAAFAVIAGPHGKKELVNIVEPSKVMLVTGKPGQLLFVPLWTAAGNHEEVPAAEN